MLEAALFLAAICFAFVAIYFIRSEAFSAFHPLSIYLVFHGFIFVFRPILGYLLDYRAVYLAYQFNPSASDKLTVILASTVGMLAFAFMCLQSGHSKMVFKQDSFAIAERNRLAAPAFWAMAICVPLGILSLVLGWNEAASGATTMLMDRATGTFTNTQSNGYLAEAQLMLATCCAMLGWFFRFRLVALMPLAGFIIFRAGTGGRGPFVTAAVCLGLLYLYEHRLRMPTLRLVLLGAAVLSLFTVIGDDRGRSVRLLFGDDNSVTYDVRSDFKFLEWMDYANQEYFEYLVYAVPQRTGTYEYFADNLQLLTEPIPRALWTGKPVGSPVKFFYLFDYGNPIGMTRSLPGEGWVQLGWFGVIIWCGLWGYGLGWLYRKFVDGAQSTIAVLSYLMFTAMLIVIYRDGTLMTLFRQAIFYFFPIILWRIFASYLGVPRAKELRELAWRRAWLARPAGGDAASAVVDAPASLPVLRRKRGATAVAAVIGEALPPAAARRRARLQEAKLLADKPPEQPA